MKSRHGDRHPVRRFSVERLNHPPAQRYPEWGIEIVAASRKRHARRGFHARNRIGIGWRGHRQLVRTSQNTLVTDKNCGIGQLRLTLAALLLQLCPRMLRTRSRRKHSGCFSSRIGFGLTARTDWRGLYGILDNGLAARTPGTATATKQAGRQQ
jgi:hypothetical protein